MSKSRELSNKRKAKQQIETTKHKRIKRQRSHLEDSEEEPIGVSCSLSTGRNQETMYGSSITGLTLKNKVGKRNSSSFLGSVGAVKRSSLIAPEVNNKEEEKRQKRQARFANMESDPVLRALNSSLSSKRQQPPGVHTITASPKTEIEHKESNGFVGTCQNLEKPYLRLTTFPKAEDVRPLNILARAFEHIRRRFHESQDFEWANEQMKSLRQDLTVQGIRNDFVLNVYETHARMALENGALNEFNQCQTMIRSLTLGLSNDTDLEVRIPAVTDSISASNANVNLLQQTEGTSNEFASYRLLYALVQKNWADVTKELVSAAVIMTRNNNKSRSDHHHHRSKRMCSCKHAILVTRAVTHDDYHSFFVLYNNAPHMSGYLMDFLVQRVREGAYKRIVAAYRPTVSVEFFRETLFFHDLDATRSFLRRRGAKFMKEAGVPPFWVDCKASHANMVE